MMTEDEAKTKACCGPHALVALWLAVEKGWAPATGLISGNCIGSACMAWMWLDRSYEYATTRNLVLDEETTTARAKTHPNERMPWHKAHGEPSPPPGDGWEADSEMAQAHGYTVGTFERRWRRAHPCRHGYCGLAGRPE
jgi:hypothetical protein